MRKRNWRLIIVGVVLLGTAGLFFLAIPRSNDPAALMSTVGQVSGAVGGISMAMIIVGLIGKKALTGWRRPDFCQAHAASMAASFKRDRAPSPTLIRGRG
jgi:hypothetical protein